MANRKNSHRRRVRVAVLMVLCGAVFAAFFARLAWMQFVRADYYADKAAEAKVIQAEAEAKVAQATELREPHRIARYLESLAATYHAWYGQCRVTPRGDDPVEPGHVARLWLNDAVTQVLRTGLGLLGVSAPERM